MPATIDLTETAIEAAVRTVLSGIVATTVEIVRGQVNRVPPPQSADYIVMTPVGRWLLSLPVETWDQTNPNPTSINEAAHSQMRLQLDVHGPNSGDNAAIINATLRSSYGTTQFAAQFAGKAYTVAPLYVDEPKQIPFDDGEQQVEERWVVDLMLQANANITLTQDFANQLVVGIVDVDTRYAP